MLTPTEIVLALHAAGHHEAAEAVRALARKRREQSKRGH